MLEALEKLREHVDKQREEYNNHNVSFVWQLDTIADEIQAEIDANYLELPKDADGVPIHIGDTVEGQPLGCSRVKGSVTTYYIHDNDEPDSIYIKVDCGNGTWAIRELRTERCHHVKPRTLEDIVQDAIQYGYSHGKAGMDVSEQRDKYADEIRELLLGGDAE